MKKVLIVLLGILLILAFTGCKSAEQRLAEEAYQEAYKEAMEDSDMDEDYDYDMEPNDDGFDDDYQNEAAGVDDGDGNGVEISDTEENSITLNGGEWPSDAPSEIPVFDKAEISSVVASFKRCCHCLYRCYTRRRRSVYTGD